jgi:toxin ParE1/3/4
MPAVYVSIEAEADIDSITKYTLDTWGPRQADTYLTKLEDSFKLLARNPLIGQPCDSIRPGLHRHQVEKHVVFYVPALNGVRVVRILHERMLPSKARLAG